MKSPAELAARLARQWHDADAREARLTRADAWPLELAIGRPPAKLMTADIAKVRAHVEAWRKQDVGEVVWTPAIYRATAGPVDVPVLWRLRTPSQWIAAACDVQAMSEYARLERLVGASPACFHRLLLRQRSLWQQRSDADVLHAMRLAEQLSPGCADGRPLRALPMAGIDSKFFELHRALIVALLDQRYDGLVSEIGLEAFLHALDEGDHWLLVVPLAEGLLPYALQRIRASELAGHPPPGSHLLIVENEQCRHALPALPDTVAVLGAGLNLDWLRAPTWQSKRIAYWGDIDTWGLAMLARAREHQPGIDALLMDRALFDRVGEHAVCEPVPAGSHPPSGLLHEEALLYRHLLTLARGRLEQEFVPPPYVRDVLDAWRTRGPSHS